MTQFQNMIADGARITGKVAVIMKAAGFRAADAYQTRWTNGVSTFRVVQETTYGSIGQGGTRKTLRQVWA